MGRVGVTARTRHITQFTSDNHIVAGGVAKPAWRTAKLLLAPRSVRRVCVECGTGTYDHAANRCRTSRVLCLLLLLLLLLLVDFTCLFTLFMFLTVQMFFIGLFFLTFVKILQKI